MAPIPKLATPLSEGEQHVNRWQHQHLLRDPHTNPDSSLSPNRWEGNCHSQKFILRKLQQTRTPKRIKQVQGCTKEN